MRQDLVDMFEGKKYRTVSFMQFEHCLSSVVPYGNDKNHIQYTVAKMFYDIYLICYLGYLVENRFALK